MFAIPSQDIAMPVMDGLEATRRIREFEREAGRPRTFIVALTGARRWESSSSPHKSERWSVSHGDS